MLKKIIVFSLALCLIVVLAACTQKYYSVHNIDGEIVSVQSKGLDKNQKDILKQYEKDEIELYEVIESGEFTADQLAEFGLISMDTSNGEPILDVGRFKGLPEVDPNLLIKVVSGSATSEDIQALYDAGYTEEDIQDLMPNEFNDRNVDDEGNVLPPSD